MYIVIPGPVKRRAWQTTFVEGLKVSENATLSLLGQGSYTSESRLENSDPMTVENVNGGIFLRYIFLHNLYNIYRVANKWGNPVILKINNYAN